MKLITAIIREVQLNKVHEELLKANIERITVGRVSGHGQQKREEIYRGMIMAPSLIPKIKIEIAVNDDYVQRTVDAIISGAGTNSVGDGKIFVTNLEECIRIRTEERGEKAI
ncbi:MAG: P-II family nitrogen regulator [Bacteroidales bacterium]|jgi:nitrogen regulatory protein P-II 1|nr:P-II family nitrogen regulator [Bacteroidales bacterium]